MLKLRLAACVVAVGLMISGPAMVSGQNYPNKAIRIITSGAGGGNDFVSRMIAQGIAGPLGQPVVVENRPNSLIMGQEVSQAPADGHTLLIASSLWLLPLIQKTPFDAIRDFAPVTMIDRSPNILAVHPSLPVRSVNDLIALAKARPGELNYSAGGPGSSAQLAAELLNSMAGIRVVGIHYKGSGPQLLALVSGEVQLSFGTATSITPYIKSGRLRALAVTSLEPSALVPGMTTMAGSGLPGFEIGSTDGVLVKNGTPAAIIARLNQEVVRFLNQPGVKEKFLNIGAEVVANSPEQFAAAMKSEVSRMDKVIRDAGIRIAN